MQDFTNNNQSQPDNANNYYQDPLETDAPANPDSTNKQDEQSPSLELERNEPPMLNQNPDADDEPVIRRDQAPLRPKTHTTHSTERELNPELVDYLSSTEKLLKQSRKERNNLILRIDEEEDKITECLKSEKNDFGHRSEDIYSQLSEAKEELRRKNDLINALIKMVRSLE